MQVSLTFKDGSTSQFRNVSPGSLPSDYSNVVRMLLLFSSSEDVWNWFDDPETVNYYFSAHPGRQPWSLEFSGSDIETIYPFFAKKIFP